MLRLKSRLHAAMPTLRPTLYPLPLIGWRERVVLPKLGLGPLIAKIDTGARSAALHAEDISIRGSPRALCHSAQWPEASL